MTSSSDKLNQNSTEKKEKNSDAPNSKNSIFALSFLNILKTSEKLALPLSMTDIGFNVKRAFIGNYNQKPYYYHPDTWEHQGGDFLFIPKKNIQ